MLFSPWLERLQIKYINPVMRPLDDRLPGFAVIKHRGRTSGTPYQTIVTSIARLGARTTGVFVAEIV
jgi:hypothetical protein